MNELIWFSIPGALVVYAARLSIPEVHTAPDALIIASAPVVGFLFHQLYRAIFESCGGWESNSRRVLFEIRAAYKIPDDDQHAPFLIWETTFYSDRISNSFRDHNRGAWHYIMSFRSIVLSAAFAGLLLAVTPAFWTTAFNPLLHMVSYVGIFGLFCLKSHLTHDSLTRQEIACFHRYRPAFDETQKVLIESAKKKSLSNKHKSEDA